MGALLGKQTARDERAERSIGACQIHEDPYAEKDSFDEGDMLLAPEPPILQRQTNAPYQPKTEHMIDVGRLCPNTICQLLPDCKGQGSDVIFSILSACHLARTRQRLGVEEPSGGFLLWVLDNLWDQQQCCCPSISLKGVARLVDEYGASSSYKDNQGLDTPKAEIFIEADQYPKVLCWSLSKNTSSIKSALACGEAVACTWNHTGTARGVLSDGTVVRRIMLLDSPGLSGSPDIAAGCIVGYDPPTGLFFGYSPSVGGKQGMIGFYKEFLERRCLDVVCVRLEERKEGSNVCDVDTETDTTVDHDDCDEAGSWIESASTSHAAAVVE